MQEREYISVPRNLDSTHYLIHKRLWGGFTIRLQPVDVGLVMVPPVIIWYTLSKLGLALEPMPFVRFAFEPWGLYLMIILTAAVISLIHGVWPRMSLTRAIEGAVAARQYQARARVGDRAWQRGAAHAGLGDKEWTF